MATVSRTSLMMESEVLCLCSRFESALRYRMMVVHQGESGPLEGGVFR